MEAVPRIGKACIGSYTTANKVIISMNLSQLYYFRKLAELQHYTKAAKELYISQPALSDAIKSLERELGVPLFKREGRNVRLTRYGREFADYVGRALRDYLAELAAETDVDMMLQKRYEKFRKIGVFRQINQDENEGV